MILKIKYELRGSRTGEDTRKRGLIYDKSSQRLVALPGLNRCLNYDRHASSLLFQEGITRQTLKTVESSLKPDTFKEQRRNGMSYYIDN